jgi:hypothetical protein
LNHVKDKKGVKDEITRRTRILTKKRSVESFESLADVPFTGFPHRFIVLQTLLGSRQGCLGLLKCFLGSLELVGKDVYLRVLELVV